MCYFEVPKTMQVTLPRDGPNEPLVLAFARLFCPFAAAQTI